MANNNMYRIDGYDNKGIYHEYVVLCATAERVAQLIRLNNSTHELLLEDTNQEFYYEVYKGD